MPVRHISLPGGLTPSDVLVPAALCTFIVRHGLTKKSLSTSGAIAATVVGLGTFTNTPYVFSTVLLTFFLSSSKMTKVILLSKLPLEASSGEERKIRV